MYCFQCIIYSLSFERLNKAFLLLLLYIVVVVVVDDDDDDCRSQGWLPKRMRHPILGENFAIVPTSLKL